MNINAGLNYMLLGRWLDTEFEAKYLADISVETFNNIKQQMLDIFEGCELIDADIKAAWKEWFEWNIYNGTLVKCGVSPYLEVDIMKCVLKQASEAIDKLPTEDNKPAVPTNLVDMKKYLSDNEDRIDPTDAYYIQWHQANAIRESIMDLSYPVATDQVIFTFGNKTLSIGCFNAEAVGSFNGALFDIMQNAIEEINLS